VIVLTFSYIKCTSPCVNHYKWKSYIAVCTGLIVKLRSQLLVPSNTTVYNTYMSFVLTAWRWSHWVETCCHI